MKPPGEPNRALRTETRRDCPKAEWTQSNAPHTTLCNTHDKVLSARSFGSPHPASVPQISMRITTRHDFWDLPRFRSLALLLVGCSSVAWAFPVAASVSLQELKLTASDAALNDHFGRSLAVAGNTALMGSRYDGHSGSDLAGSGYIFVRNGSSWLEQAKLIASDAEFADLFGHSVAIFGDTAILGARNDDHSGLTDAGSAYIFVRNGTSWTEQAKLTANDAEAFDHFGICVDIEGDTAVVGASFDDHAGGIDAGSAYVFVRSGTRWSLQAKLTAGDAAALDLFGWSAALAGDRLVLGAPLDDHAGGISAGSAYVFERAGTSWSLQAKLVANDAEAGDQFGNSATLSGDTAVLGAPRDDHAGGINSGSAYVFLANGANWSQQAMLTPNDAAANDDFGHTVTLKGDTAIVGSPQDEFSGLIRAGSAYAFVRVGTSWSEQVKFTASDAALGDNFGSSVALSGPSVLIGAPHDDLGREADAGSVHVYLLETDCNGNGVPDAQDLASGISADCNNNLIPDECDLAAGTSLDLDAEGTPDECQPFSANGASLSISAGGTIEFALHAGPIHAGGLFIVLGSVSGTAPGVAVDGQVLPLNPDAYLLLTLSGGGPLHNGIGLVDGSGSASAFLAIPPGLLAPVLAGLVVQHAYAVADPVSLVVTLTSNPIPTILLP